MSSGIRNNIYEINNLINKDKIIFKLNPLSSNGMIRQFYRNKKLIQSQVINTNNMGGFWKEIYDELNDHIEQNKEIKTYEYNFEYPEISKQKDKEKVFNEITETFEQQLKDWIYG